MRNQERRPAVRSYRRRPEGGWASPSPVGAREPTPVGGIQVEVCGSKVVRATCDVFGVDCALHYCIFACRFFIITRLLFPLEMGHFGPRRVPSLTFGPTPTLRANAWWSSPPNTRGKLFAALQTRGPCLSGPRVSHTQWSHQGGHDGRGAGCQPDIILWGSWGGLRGITHSQ